VEFSDFFAVFYYCACVKYLLRVLTGGTNVQSGYIQVKPEESVSLVVLLSTVISISLVEMLGKSRPQMLKTGYEQFPCSISCDVNHEDVC
jgi:hypothetical protein